MPASKPHKHSERPAKTSGMILAFWLNTAFAVIEFAGGAYTNSTAIVTDAIHDLGDSISIGLGLLLEKVSGRKRTSKYTFGYKRFSLLSALILSLVLLSGSGIMLYKAIVTIQHPQEVNSQGMLWLGILGVLVNGFAFFRMRQDKHNRNSKAVMLHFLEDVLGWIAVLIGAVVIHYTQWFIIDPILSVCIALFIIYNACTNIIETMKILLMAVPAELDIKGLKTELKQLKGVEGVHDLHVWSLDGEYTVSSVHLVIKEEGKQPPNILQNAQGVFRKFSIQHPTVQIESKSLHCQLTDK